MLLALGVAADPAGDGLGLLRVAHHEGVDADEAEAEGAGDHDAVGTGSARRIVVVGWSKGGEKTYVGEVLPLVGPIEWSSAGLVVEDDDGEEEEDSHRRAMRAGAVAGRAGARRLVRRAAERER